MTPGEMFQRATGRDAGTLTIDNLGTIAVVGWVAPIAGAYAGVKLWKAHPVLGGIGGFLVGQAGARAYMLSQVRQT